MTYVVHHHPILWPNDRVRCTHYAQGGFAGLDGTVVRFDEASQQYLVRLDRWPNAHPLCFFGYELSPLYEPEYYI